MWARQGWAGPALNEKGFRVGRAEWDQDLPPADVSWKAMWVDRVGPVPGWKGVSKWADFGGVGDERARRG